MRYNPIPARDVLLTYFYYRPDTGKLYRRGTDVEAGWTKRTKFKPAYRMVTLEGKKYYVHRIIWVILRGSVSDEVQVDHEDGDGLNNRPHNLRLADNEEQHKNKHRSVRNTSGCTGVFWADHANKWRATLNCGGIRYDLGLFSDFDDAVRARKEAEMKHMFHVNHDRVLPGRI